MAEKTFNDEIDFNIDDFTDNPAVAHAIADADQRFQIFGELIEARKAKKMTQKEVAKAMGTTQSAISDLENGNSDPQISTIQRYARVVGSRLTACIIRDLMPNIASDEEAYPSELQARIHTSTTYVPKNVISLESRRRASNSFYARKVEAAYAG